jgi:hypothetical protein
MFNGTKFRQFAYKSITFILNTIIMIDKKVFLENLVLTQVYCDDKIKDASKSLAEVLRTINPEIGGVPIFDFERTQLEYLDNKQLTVTKWNLNDNQYYTEVVLDLFVQQLAVKKQYTKTSDTHFEGRILVSEYTCSVTDGASEVEAEGLVDIYDLPPIDTWFYIDHLNKLLFSWVPEKYMLLFDNAVVVNCVDLFKWMDIHHKELYVSIFGKAPLNYETSSDSFANQTIVKKEPKSSFWNFFRK